MTPPDAPTAGIPSYIDGLSRRLADAFGSDLGASKVHAGQLTIELPQAGAHGALHRLSREFGFAQLIDLCGVDYLAYGNADWETSEAATAQGFSRGRQAQPVDRGDALFDFASSAPDAGERAGSDRRYAVVYHLLSHARNERLRVRVFAVDEPPRVETVVDIWAVADWYEREAFDLYGILFEGHPDLRRLLTDYGFVGHPFRKDFPLSGEVEVRYDASQRRVVYEPVSIEPRTLVPRVIRAAGGAQDEPEAPLEEQAD